MSNEKIGISILTNGNRSQHLSRCITSLLVNMHYRPLVIGILDNGSIDDTPNICKKLSESVCYGVEFRIQRNETDLGCACGTNDSIGLVKEANLILHLESDFEHLPGYLTGEDPMWLHHVIQFMNTGECDYMYLRRMVNERDIYQHWWSQWMTKIDRKVGNYLHCPDFWWSNNPTVFRTKAMYDCGTLPLDVTQDGPKGSPWWSKPELNAKKPTKAWIHKWGLFVHELPLQPNVLSTPGMSNCQDGSRQCVCKYGFFKSSAEQSSGARNSFCTYCDRSKGFEDMDAHAKRVMPGL